MSNWNFRNKSEMISLLIGREFGDVESFDESQHRERKLKAVKFISDVLRLKPHYHILEIGSGGGHLAKEIAPRVSRLYCGDIAGDFLKLAEDYCKDLSNISFHKMNYGKFDFISDESLDGIYANNVFIHFNLFDIYHYLNAVFPKLKSGGRIIFDYANARRLEKKLPDLFYQMADLYLKDRKDVDLLVQWQDPTAVIAIAKTAGFSVVKGNAKDSFLALKKN